MGIQPRIPMKTLALIFCTSALAMAECPQLKFDQDTLDLGKIDQSASAHFKIGYQNLGKEKLSFSEVFAQGRGPQNIKFTKDLEPNTKGEISFDLNTNTLVGYINENISLQGPNICLYPLPIKGFIQPALMFSPAQLNLGSLKEDNLPSFTVYAWDPRGKSQIQAGANTLGYFDTQMSPVKITVKDGEAIEDKNGQDAWKIQLRLKKIPETQNGRKSLSLILPFQNANFPKAESVIFAAGWKGELPTPKNP